MYHLIIQLGEGLYNFNVVVTGDNAYGSDFINVTVHPTPRINTSPVAVIQPSNQIVTLPSKDTILDGSRKLGFNQQFQKEHEHFSV